MKVRKKKIPFHLNRWMPVVLMIGLLFPVSVEKVDASKTEGSGFVIHADRIEGAMSAPTLVVGETADKRGQPMLRFQYESAVIHGLTLTKVVDTPNGPMTVTITSPIAKATNMKLDITAFSMGGTCLKLGEQLPQVALKNVTLVGHKQTADSLDLGNAQISSVAGNKELERPDTAKIIKDLEGLSVGSLQGAIDDLLAGHVPLTCKDGEDSSGTNDQSEDPLAGVLDDGHGENDTGDLIDDRTDPVGKSVDETNDTVGEVTDDVEDAVDDVTHQTTHVLDHLLGEVDTLLGDTTDLLGRIDGHHDALDGLVDSITNRSIEPIEQLMSHSLDENRLEKVDTHLGKLESETRELKEIENHVKSSKSKLDQLQVKLNEEKRTLQKLSGNHSRIGTVEERIYRAQSKIDQGTKLISQMEGTLQQTKGDIEHTIKAVSQKANEKEDGLLGGLLNDLSGVLKRLFNDIDDKISDIEELLDQ